MLLKRSLILSTLFLASAIYAPVAMADHQAYAVSILEESKSPLNRQAMLLITQKDYVGLEALLKQAENINAADAKGVRPVHYAAYMGSTEAMNLLIKHGAALTGATFGGWTTLHYAAHGGHVEMSKLRVSNGVPIEVKDTGGETALFYAVEKNMTSVVQWLLANGANVNNGNNKGEMPLDVAKANQYGLMIELLKNAGAKDGV
jgi:ankyrin repeat protein